MSTEEVETSGDAEVFLAGIITRASNTVKDLERHGTDHDAPHAANRILRTIKNAEVDLKRLHIANVGENWGGHGCPGRP